MLCKICHQVVEQKGMTMTDKSSGVETVICLECSKNMFMKAIASLKAK